MPMEVGGCVYYRTSEACREIGISRATLFRWLKEGVIKELHRDRRGWRMFTEEDLEKIRTEAKQIKLEKNL
jgi:excisionase family DNA binding protein